MTARRLPNVLKLTNHCKFTYKNDRHTFICWSAVIRDSCVNENSSTTQILYAELNVTSNTYHCSVYCITSNVDNLLWLKYRKILAL